MALRFGNQNAPTSGLIFDDQGSFSAGEDIFGTGVLQSQPATVSGSGQRGAVDTGSPPDLDASSITLSGVGERIITGSGALSAQSSAVAATGDVTTILTGSGVLSAQAGSAAGVGNIGIGGSGVLQALSVTVIGSGLQDGLVQGAGSLLAQSAVAAGTGERSITGVGQIIASSVMVSGSGISTQIAVDYDSSLTPNTIDVRFLSIRSTYEQEFERDRKVPRSVTVGWDELVLYADGIPPADEVSYEFSGGKEFLEDQSTYPHSEEEDD